MAFVDEVRIFVTSGSGGKGCESFYRNKYFRHARPNGGDGGKGGDAVFIADPRVQTLLDYRFKQHYKAESGGHGGSKEKTGKSGRDCELRVPVGTILRDEATGLLIRDLTRPGEKVIAVRGGTAGRGNRNNQTPSLPGPAVQKAIRLELKLIADVGLVGMPNAGKSTLITKISRVRSRIADYPFTTRQPILGVVQDEDDGSQFIVADLPGLIDGAHEGRGLGDRFLKHAERTRILVHVIDMAGTEGRDPLEDYRTICHELSAYSGQLAVKKKIVVANKMDIPEAHDHLERFRRHVEERVFPISALNDKDLEPLVDDMRHFLKLEAQSRDEGENDGQDISAQD